MRKRRQHGKTDGLRPRKGFNPRRPSSSVAQCSSFFTPFVFEAQIVPSYGVLVAFGFKASLALHSAVEEMYIDVYSRAQGP